MHQMSLTNHYYEACVTSGNKPSFILSGMAMMLFWVQLSWTFKIIYNFSCFDWRIEREPR